MKKKSILLTAGALALGLFGIKHASTENQTAQADSIALRNQQAQMHAVSQQTPTTNEQPQNNDEGATTDDVSRIKLEQEVLESYKLFNEAYSAATSKQKMWKQELATGDKEIHDIMFKPTLELAAAINELRPLLSAQDIETGYKLVKALEEFEPKTDEPQSAPPKEITPSTVADMSVSELKETRDFFEEQTLSLQLALNQDSIDVFNKFQIRFSRFDRAATKILDSLSEINLPPEEKNRLSQQIETVRKALGAAMEPYQGMP